MLKATLMSTFLYALLGALSGVCFEWHHHASAPPLLPMLPSGDVTGPAPPPPEPLIASMKPKVQQSLLAQVKPFVKPLALYITNYRKQTVNVFWNPPFEDQTALGSEGARPAAPRNRFSQPHRERVLCLPLLISLHRPSYFCAVGEVSSSQLPLPRLHPLLPHLRTLPNSTPTPEPPTPTPPQPHSTL